MEDFIETDRLVQVHRALVHKRHGIISSLIEEAESPDARGLFVFNGLAVEASYFRDNCFATKQDARNGSGAAFDRAAALWATFGETIERYSGYIYSQDDLIRDSADNLGNAAVSLNDFILFSNEQYAKEGFPFFPANTSLTRNWTEAVDLSDGNKPILVPATTVYLGMKLANPRENMAQSVSTGLSCGQTFERAAMGGLCEVIERDAFSAMWQLSYAPPRLIVTDETMASLAPGVQRALKNENVKITLWSIETETGIPVLLAMAESAPEGLVAVGACANPNLERAISKAVIEGLHGLIWSRHLRNRDKPMPTAEEIRDPSDHISYYLEPGRRHLLDFLFANTNTVSSSDIKHRGDQSLDEMVAHLKGHGFSTLAKEVTTTDAAEIGLHVVRVIVPGLHPLLFGHQIISLDERRLRRIAKIWGLDPFPPTNQSPHPFP
jgi:ribosomal protein S12 methylthiotransferase accessory factor